MELVTLIATGLVAGIISGMGVGGGIVLIPMLTLVLGFDQKTAQGVNLLYFIPTALPALWVHWKQRNIEVKPALPMMLTGAVGAVAGALLAMHTAPELLRKVFGGFLILIALYEFKLAFKH